MVPKKKFPNPSYLSMLLMIGMGFLLWGCPKDMEEQPSFSFQEAPRLHSPKGSVPQAGPVFSRKSTQQIAHGPDLFAINCAHCHGEGGMGDGAVAGYLPDVPANLQASAVQQKPDAQLYNILTNGEKIMPAFELFLSSEERWAIVAFLRTLTEHAPASIPLMEESN